MIFIIAERLTFDFQFFSQRNKNQILKTYSIALIRDTIKAITNPKMPIKANENRRLNNSAI